MRAIDGVLGLLLLQGRAILHYDKNNETKREQQVDS